MVATYGAEYDEGYRAGFQAGVDETESEYDAGYQEGADYGKQELCDYLLGLGKDGAWQAINDWARAPGHASIRDVECEWAAAKRDGLIK